MTKDTKAQTKRALHRVRLPGFVSEAEIGLGDAIKRVAYSLGFQPCGSCERRAAALNRWVGFTGRSK